MRQHIVDKTYTLYHAYRRQISQFINRRGGVEVERSPRVREIGVRSPVATDLSR